MNKYNKTQKHFLNYLVRYKRNSALLPFSEIFYSYIEKNYKEIEIELIKNEIIFYKKEVKKNILLDSIRNSKFDKKFYNYVDEIMSLVYLIIILKDEKSIVYYGEENELKNKYRIKDSSKKVFKTKLDLKIEKELNRSFLISPNLKELINDEFRTLEQKSLLLTQKALYISIFFSFLSLGLNWCTSTSVTKIEFNKPEQLKEISTTTIYLK